MKKHKIKPEVVWMPWHDEPGFLIGHWAYNKSTCLKCFTEEAGETWPQLRKQGWHIVKVRISEVK